VDENEAEALSHGLSESLADIGKVRNLMKRVDEKAPLSR
jgi:hypothetical protein